MAYDTMPGSQGEMAEWLKAAVLKTVVGQLTGGSNPSLSATNMICLFSFTNTGLTQNFVNRR